ncbi:MAG TPA: CaiB/BaiF CoA-transferase family protein [Methylomirabilota bacterium]|nr:CaiB/BaiF CoA-transferase family protein [Methylomirabilota bacterium]
MAQSERPLDGMLVVDVSRMLPGAVLARQLLDLGARLVKVEEPGTGDPMRMVPPLVEGIGLGFATYLRGAESVCLDLASSRGRDHLRRLAGRADVLVESFRPGTMEGWGLGWADLEPDNRRLVWCSLSSWGRAEKVRRRVAHDLNLIAESGALAAMASDGLPRIQLADVGAGLLAASAILAALLRRERTGRGARLDQPLATGALAFMAWRWAEEAAGRDRVVELLLGSGCPCYRTYRCGDGGRIAVAALEPKFWSGFCGLLGLGDELRLAAFAVGAEGARVVAEIEACLAGAARDEWLRRAAERELPVSAVHEPAEAVADPIFEDAGLIGPIALPGGDQIPGVGPLLPSLGRASERPAPALGEHTDTVLAELDGT